jgi:hypothetical protein
MARSSDYRIEDIVDKVFVHHELSRDKRTGYNADLVFKQYDAGKDKAIRLMERLRPELVVPEHLWMNVEYAALILAVAHEKGALDSNGRESWIKRTSMELRGDFAPEPIPQGDGLDPEAVARRRAFRDEFLKPPGAAIGEFVESREYKIEEIEFLFKLSLSGEIDADLVLRDFVARLLLDGRRLPKVLRAYAALALRNRIPRGRKPRNTNFVRDNVILRAVASLVEAGFKRTRNRATDHHSACSIVAAILAQLNIGVGEEAVEKIVKKIRRSTSSAATASDN